MGLFVDQKTTFKVVVKYVFTDDGEVHILTDEDVENIAKSSDDKKALEDTLTHATDVPFNVPIDILDLSPEDIKEAAFNFRKPSFDDMPSLLSSFVSISSSGDVSPGDVFEFNNRKLKLLFINGAAQDENGDKAKINEKNVGYISPVLGSAMAVRMNAHVNL